MIRNMYRQGHFYLIGSLRADVTSSKVCTQVGKCTVEFAEFASLNPVNKGTSNHKVS